MPASRHPKLQHPPDDAQVWRYMSFEKLISLIETRSLFYAGVNLLRREDRFEASLPRRVWEKQMEANRRGAGVVSDDDIVGYSDSNERWRQTFFAGCWCVQQHEDNLMWRVYGGSNRGIAVQTTYARLVSAARPEDQIGLVRYEDFDSYEVAASS